MSLLDLRSTLAAPKGPQSPEHAAVLKYARKCIEKSRKDMSRHYSRWDMNDAEFRSQRKLDKEDSAATAKGQPAKMVVPLSKAQILTFVAYCVTTLSQNRRFFELEPTGKEDDILTEPIELVLERDTRKNQWSTFLVQFFLDIGRFTLGAAEVCYEETTRKIRIETNEATEEAFAAEAVEQKTSTYVDVPVFVGNRVHSVSPYHFFPDTDLPITRYQEGEFCGSEDFFSYNSLLSDPNCFNVDKIPKMTEKDRNDRIKTTRGNFTDFEVRTNPNMNSDGTYDEGDYVRSGRVLVTKLVCDIVPANFKVDNVAVGPEKFPVRYCIWYANDKTVIRFEEAYYLHGMFPYICAQYLPDQHKILSDSLADDCSALANWITWRVNSHTTSIRGSIESRWIVDPAGIDIKSLESRSPYIYLKKNASSMGVDRFIKQFETADPSANFLQEVSGMNDILERCTSFGNNMMGAYASGRRSATEARGVSQGATARAKTHLSTIWDSAFEPLARQLIANNRQEMSADTFQRIVGAGPFGDANGVQIDANALYAMFHPSDPVQIALSEDFFVFDGTLPSEKSFLAQSLQEILTMIFSNPEISAVYGFGPDQVRVLLDDIYQLRGVTNARLPAPAKAPTQPGMMPPQVVPMPPQPGAAPAVAPIPALSNGQ